MSNSTSGSSIYIPTDKNIFDALQHKKVTQSSLVKFLRGRGILVDPKSPKDLLVTKITTFTFSYSDFIWLSKLLENPNRKDKTTHSKLKGVVTPDQISKAFQTTKSNIEVEDSVKVIKNGDKTTLSVTYVDYDFTKTELKQRTVKTCDIEVEKNNDNLIFKMPSTKKAREITERLKATLLAEIGDDVVIEDVSITLESFLNPETRSYFFDALIRDISGYKFDTVTSVEVFHLVEEVDEEANSSTDARLASYINKAALAGEGVLESQEFKQLHTRGFYIYKIIWTVISENKTGEHEKVEFEAQFGTPSACTDFKYSARGVYNFNENTKAHNVTRRSTYPRESQRYDLLLREASERAFEKVKNKYGNE
jgi:hypothetical protein